jgi:glucose/arabinose dehydrogenase
MLRITLTLVVVAVALVLGFGPLVQAQQPAQAPPPWKQGQPSSMTDSTLAPIAQPPAPKAPGEIPVDKIKVPAGFKVSLWAHGINNARVMTWGSKGTLFVSSRTAGNVYAVLDNGSTRDVKVIAKGLNLPNGVAFKDGTLYIAEVSRISKMVGIEDKLDNPPAMETVYETLPKDLPHGWKYLAFGPDGKLYFNIGAPCNICMPPDTHANLSRVNPDGTGFEYVAHGVRNSVGFDWHPVTKDLYFTTHGRDWLGDDAPSDRFDVASKKGLHFGFPYCHQGDILDPEFGKGKSCSDYVKPILKTGPHVAGNGVQFYTGSMFPSEYQTACFSPSVAPGIARTRSASA